jgi:predicted acyltransferase
MTTEILKDSQQQELQTFKRADALDALRGIAILAMILSGTIPFSGVLPAWMYHAQLPPPAHKFNPDLPGLTWVDLVFPLFIFALGAAIPLAQSRRLAKGWTQLQVILSIFKRGFLLASFAIVSQHFRPFTINPEPVEYKWRFGLIGFVILFLMFVQLPKSVPKWGKIAVPAVGWTAGIIFLANLQYPYHEKYKTFSLYRSDIILLLLANVAVFTALIWLVTRKNMGRRLILLVFLFPLLLSFNEGGWNTKMIEIPALSWLFNFDYLKYLFISIPATLVGDRIVAWLETGDREEKVTWKKGRCVLIICLMFALTFNVLVGLQARWLEQTAVLSILFCCFGFWLVKNPKSDTEHAIETIYVWACYWLILGLAFEPYQGGIKKDSATMSYFFVTTAISIFILIALIVIINIFQQKRWLQLLIDNGKNPMLAYVAFGNLLWPILELTGWQRQIDEMTKTPWPGFFKGLIYTSIIAILVSLCTRLKLFWKT